MLELQLDPSLKLTFCPRCDYSLNGLPEAGICPECGEAYTADFIVISGRPVRWGDEPNVPVVMKPLDRSPGPRWARNAGLSIGRLVRRK